METTNTILEEVKGISPVVAGIGNRHPYTVPPAYFDNLPVQLMLRIAIEEKAGTDPLLNINKNNVYQAPENYFDGLAGTIMSRIKAQETGNAREELEWLSPLLGQVEKKNPFSFPDGYFNDFSDNIMAGVKAIEFVNEELENLSPLMLDLRNRQVYEVPGGYFDTVAANILHKAKQQPAKIISIGFGKKIMRYAAAAVVAGIVALSGYLYVAKNSSIPGDNRKPFDTASFAKVSDPEIENFLNNNIVALADIGTDTDSLNTATSVDAGSNADDTKDLLADISDEELQKYVDQQSETPITN
jgi:hypothetical protein